MFGKDAKKHRDDIICTNEALEWCKKIFKLLGKDFVTNLQNIFDMNFRLKFQHMKINNEIWKPLKPYTIGLFNGLKNFC